MWAFTVPWFPPVPDEVSFLGKREPPADRGFSLIAGQPAARFDASAAVSTRFQMYTSSMEPSAGQR